MTVRERVIYALKMLVSHALYYLGLMRLWQSIVMRRKAVVLMYHRVLTAEERSRSASHPALVVGRDTFERQMSVLKRRFVVLSVEEFANCLERKVPFPNSSCVITFDDGWRDNYTNALQVLNQHVLPAVVFLPVSYIGRPRLFWQEALTHLLLSSATTVRRDPARRGRLHALLAPTGLQDVLDLSEDPKHSIIAAVGTQKRWPRSVVEQLIENLASELGIHIAELAPTDGFIDWEQAETMARRGIAFGGHGVPWSQPAPSR
jgi:peptidoglycan/xylan/chitin deacetylase (PgdA/CDA1 family)